MDWLVGKHGRSIAKSCGANILFYAGQRWLRDATLGSQISIPDDKELIKELSEIRYNYSSERKIKIEPKEEMKKRLGKSPDKADALALAFFPALVRPSYFTRLIIPISSCRLARV